MELSTARPASLACFAIRLPSSYMGLSAVSHGAASRFSAHFLPLWQACLAAKSILFAFDSNVGGAASCLPLTWPYAPVLCGIASAGSKGHLEIWMDPAEFRIPGESVIATDSRLQARASVLRDTAGVRCSSCHIPSLATPWGCAERSRAESSCCALDAPPAVACEKCAPVR